MTPEIKDQEFAGRVALVTGASRGIGAVLTEALAARGADVVMVARDEDWLKDAARRIGAAHGVNCRAVAGDAADAQLACRAIAAARELGGLDLLANVAGWYPTALVEHTGDEDYARTLASNLGATFAMCRAALPELRKRSGAIVNMSSTAARFPTPGLAVYGASKCAIEGLTRALAIEAAPAVRVNAVSAGPTLTETVRELMETDTTGAVAAVTSALPLGRLARPEEIAEVFLFLGSSRASVITGQVIHANCGGYMA